MPDDSAIESSKGAKRSESVRCKPVERHQLMLRAVDVEKLVEKHHPVRAIWELVSQLDLEGFYSEIDAVEGQAGRPVWDPKVLISLWLYGYKDAVSSAREISQLCEHHPAYQWLTGMEVVNYHTLADFRVAHQEALDQMFIDILAVLGHQGLITLKRVMHDGTKIKAAASDQSFHRQQTLEAHLQEAQEHIQAMGDPCSEQMSGRVAKARERALREKSERLQEALKELAELKALHANTAGDEPDDQEKKKAFRASSTDPQARVMMGAKGAYGPAYNVQISTDAEAKIIVAMEITQSSSDAGELEPAVERIEKNLEQKPEQMVADAAYPTQGCVEAMAEQGIDLIAPLPENHHAQWDSLKRRGVHPQFYPEAFSYDATGDSYRCPAGKLLSFESEERKPGWIRRRYRARRADCQSCPFQTQCCPASKKGRSVVRAEKSAAWVAFQTKMHSEAAQQIYKQRAGVAEFPNAWIKEKFGLRQFRLRGVVKVRLEALWACLTYNICQWIRLCWKPQQWAQA